ncbi:alcohol oxidase-like protein [Xylariaceae sp. FL0594]|nr:alcohol oxidase-like protein [Xylariaceae sp. FL0594]
MPLYRELPEEIDGVDVIVAGGGTAGCIVASRLSDADPKLSVLVIEQGLDGSGDPTVATPAIYGIHLKGDSPRMQTVKAKPSAELNGRAPDVLVGKGLGGTSTVNGMMYSRVEKSDAESWQAPGWSTEDLLPLMKKVETYHGPGRREQHGYEGPVHVSAGTYPHGRLADSFIAASVQMGWADSVDMADLDTHNGVQRALRYISPDGRRQDTAHCYLHPRLRDGRHPNLHVLVESQVVKVLFDDAKKANGVVYVPAGAAGQRTRTVKAAKMVVISSGALGTPLILERSGVGDPKILRAAGIEPIAEVPGVGATYDDHQNSLTPYFSSLEVHETIDGLLNGRLNMDALDEESKKLLGWNGSEGSGKLRPSASDVDSLGPHFKAHWDRNFANDPAKPMMGITLIAANARYPSEAPVGQYFTIVNFDMYPVSSGHIHVTGPNVDDVPDFDPAFLSDEGKLDVTKYIWAYKTQREIARRMSVYRGELAMYHPRFAPDSNAACSQDKLQGPPDVQDNSKIEYTAEDDAAIEDWIRKNINTAWHPMGTCKMLPLSENGVVDDRLSVYKVTGLKIADLSVLPRNVAAHPTNIAMVIGEKAAELIIEELGLPK